MAGGEYEPDDSRLVQGTKGDPGKSWREQEPPGPADRGELEPGDSRNVEGTASTPDGRWTNTGGKTPPGVRQEKPMDAHDAALAGRREERRKEPGEKRERDGG